MRKFWKLFITLCLALILVVCLLLLNIIGQQPKPILLPNPVPPTPNAYDTFNTAASEIQGYINRIDNLSPSGHHKATTTELANLFKDNSQVFIKVKQGLQQSYLSPPVRSMNTNFSAYIGFRALARLLMIKARLQEKVGDRFGAIETRLDCVQLGTQMQQSSGLLAQLTGDSIEALGLQGIWKDLNGLSSSDYRSLIAQLELINRNVYPYKDVIQQEEWTGIAQIEQTFDTPGMLAELCRIHTSKGTVAAGVIDAYMHVKLATYGGPNKIIQSYMSYMNSLFRTSTYSYGLHHPLPPTPDDPINRRFCSYVNTSELIFTRIEVDRDLLLLALALHAYHSQYGRYPQTLKQLVPAYLPSLPQDEFAAEGTYHYRLTGKSFLLYSVGPDGKDDGGKPIETVDGGKKRFNVITASSKGDIVAGIN